LVQANFSDKAKRDYILVQKAVNEKDEQAYAKLMSLYRDSIYFMLLKMVSNKDDAEDLTIEAFGKAFIRLHQYTPSYAFSTWLFRIASNNCIDFLRKKRMHLLSIDNEDEGNPTINLKSSSLNPEQQAIKNQKSRVMHDIVGKLKPRYKILIQLRYFDELSYDEISKELDMPLGTVKAQLFRAREVLQTILKPKIDNI
jgi:RNA polymerase sigma-70 factor (ECF subfamily)